MKRSKLYGKKRRGQSIVEFSLLLPFLFLLLFFFLELLHYALSYLSLYYTGFMVGRTVAFTGIDSALQEQKAEETLDRIFPLAGDKYVEKIQREGNDFLVTLVYEKPLLMPLVNEILRRGMNLDSYRIPLKVEIRVREER